MVVNQVSNNINAQKGATFSDFKQPKNGYYIQPAPTIEERIDKKKLAIRIGLGLLLLGATSFGAVKAMPKSAVKKFDQFKQYLEKKLEKEATDSKRAVFYRTTLKAATGFGEKCQGINNIISFKDIWFKRKITDKIPIVDRACQGITNWFKGIGKFTVRHSYASTVKKFNSLDDLLNNVEREILVRDKGTLISVNGITRSSEEWVKILAEKRRAVSAQVNAHFSPNSFRNRTAEIEDMMVNLEDEVWNASFGDRANFRKKDTYFSFVADRILAVDKAKFGQKIHDLRSLISYNPKDQADAIMKLLIQNKRILNPKDNVSEKLFRELTKQMTVLAGVDRRSPEYVNLQKEILANLQAFEKSIKSGSEQFKYDEGVRQAVSEHSRYIREILASDKKGTLDEMLEIYEQLLPEKEFIALRKQVRGTVKSLDNSINNETVEYVDKLRDLKLGSAPTDILTILVGVGSLGVGLVHADDSDEKISITLKYGIPAIGGLLTSMVVTSMLVSGLKSHFVGLVSSFIMNRIGEKVDDARKKYNNSHKS